jgi:CheY-like chemotaxis protein
MMSPNENGITILLAEDERSVRTVVLAMLQQQCGYHVITGVDGQNALEQSRRFEGNIDLLLSDVQMPHMTGIELAELIRVERPTIRVLLMSGMAEEPLMLPEGGQFLPKPFNYDILKEKIQYLLHYKTAQARKSTK